MRLQNHKLSASIECESERRQADGCPAGRHWARSARQSSGKLRTRYTGAQTQPTLMVPHSRVSQVCNFNIMYGALPRLQTQ